MASFLRIVTLAAAVAVAIWLRSWMSLVIVAAAAVLAWLTRERRSA